MESEKGKEKEKTTNFGLREKENGERNGMFTRVECGLRRSFTKMPLLLNEITLLLIFIILLLQSMGRGCASFIIYY